MKIIKNSGTFAITITFFILLILFFNLVLNMHPLLDFFKNMEGKRYYWTIPLSVCIVFSLWLFNKSMRKKIVNERVEIFTATIRTIQDILQNSASSMQLLVLDMKDEDVHEEIIIKAEKNIEELKAVIKTLADVDPQTIQLKELNQNLSIIKMNEN